MRVTYEVDGQQVIATCPTIRYPRTYDVRLRDGSLLGYLERSLLGRIEVYVGTVPPDAVGAHHLATYVNMRQAMERLVREVAPRDEAHGTTPR